jgi:2-haloacid dehalogenase
MPHVLVFDIGAVLLEWSPAYLYAKLIPNAEERAWFLREVLPPSWNIEQDRGRPWAEAEAERIAVFPAQASLIRAFRARWQEMVPGAIAPNVAVLERAKAAGIPTYAITNFAVDTFREAQERFSFLKTFDGAVVSGAERLIKPDPRIFEVFLERYRQRASDCLFMDDSTANVATAQALGFHTVHVTPDTDLAAEVRGHGFKV